ncbi:MAG: hypothetical protein HN353_11870 [Bdellovibrionales bacterium]|jgi:predicted XRE-type DNA-binding protein|nr:hypothetical protein [Bdellovibrionales bacterium]MBT3526847.1 hypothetical protein [Bdellovibrionales bacterium]
MRVSKTEQKRIRGKFKEIDKDIRSGKKFRSRAGVDPKTIAEALKKEICQKFVRYKTENRLTNRGIAKILRVTEPQASQILAYHFNMFSLDFLVDRLELLASVDLETKVSTDRLKISIA